jgi:hypothetical protein
MAAPIVIDSVAKYLGYTAFAFWQTYEKYGATARLGYDEFDRDLSTEDLQKFKDDVKKWLDDWADKYPGGDPWPWEHPP